MICPNCKSALEHVDYEGIEIENCGQCSGVFLDDGELKHITAARERQYDAQTRQALAKATPIQGVVLSQVDRSLKCPKCDGATKAVNYGGDTGIIIDRCLSCRGIWLDGGELEKIEMLIEGWEDELPNDLKRHGLSLRSIEDRYQQVPASEGRRYGWFLNGLIGGVFRF